MVGPSAPLFMFEADRANRWGWDTTRHSHYSEKVQSALNVYHMHWAEYHAHKKVNIQENMHRLNKVQEAFDELVRLRKKETGTGFYLDQHDYKKVAK